MTTAELPKANTLASKRIRVRKCGSRLRVPGIRRGAETVYTCTLEKHDESVPHSEVGYVHMPNDTVRWYHVEWKDEGVAQLRQHPRVPRAKIRSAVAT